MTAAGGGETRNTISGGIFFSAVIQGRDVTVNLPPEITPALSGLPSGSPAFTGRDTELHNLLDVLAPHTATADDGDAPTPSQAPVAVVAAVAGLPGIGKTELAIQAARAALDRGWFPGGILFVDLFGYDSARSVDPGQALEGFLRALAIPGEHIPPETRDRLRLYASVLAAYALEGRPILVVIDNAATHEQAKPLLPTEPASAAIVTSRDTLGLLGARLLDLDILTAENAADMLDSTLRVARPGDTRATDHPGDAARIAELCRGLPLALRIVAALLAENPHRPLAEMAADLDDERTRLDEFSYGDTAVRAAFDLSYRRLDHDGARLFRWLAINPGPDISTCAAAALAGMDVRAVRRGLEALARAHLIGPGRCYGRWRMHDLLRLYAQQLCDQEPDLGDREQARDRLLDYYLHMADAAHRHIEVRPGIPAPAEFSSRDDALAWLDGERPSLVGAVTMAARTNRDQAAMRLPLRLAAYFYWRRYFDDQIATVTIGLKAARSLGDRSNEAISLTILGTALGNTGRLEEAITAHRAAAAIFRDTGDSQNEGLALNNLGFVLKDAGRPEEAISALQTAAAIFRETGNRFLEGLALGNLGNAMQRVSRTEEASTALRAAATIFREAGDRNREAMALDDLGIVLGGTGRAEEAISAHRAAAAIFRKMGDRHSEAIALNNLGRALKNTGRVKEADVALEEAAAIFRETGDQQNEALALNNLNSDRDTQGA